MGSGDGNSDEDDSENESEQKSIPGLEHTTKVNLVFTSLLQDLPFLDQGLLICMVAYDHHAQLGLQGTMFYEVYICELREIQHHTTFAC